MEERRVRASMKNTAFTLLEIVIAMLILSMVTAGTYGLFVTNHRFIAEAKHRLQAINQATAVAERLKMFVSEVPISEVINGNELLPGEHLPSDIGLESTPSIDGVTDKEWSYVVTDMPSIEGVGEEGEEVVTDFPFVAEFKKATITIKWSEP